MVFFKARDQECEAFKDLLKVYETASWQVVNLDKSSIMFSKNFGDDVW